MGLKRGGIKDLEGLGRGWRGDVEGWNRRVKRSRRCGNGRVAAAF